MRRAREPIEPQAATAGRVGVYFGVRYLTPLLVLLALATSSVRPNPEHLTAILTAQVCFALLGHVFAMRGDAWLDFAIWTGMLVDAAAVGALVAGTGGAGGPLVFLYTLQALAAGILLSSRAGLRVLLLGTIAILAIDVASGNGLIGSPTELPRGLEAAAALWIIGGGATLFSAYNERELRRRNAELGTIRRVTLDIADSLSLEDILADLCTGVAEGFGFDNAAVLLCSEDGMRCAGAHGVTGIVGHTIEHRGRLAHALAVARPVVVTTDQARRDGALLPLLGPRGYLAVPIAEDGLLVVTRMGRRGRPGTVRAYEIGAVERLGHHARLAIANARMHGHVAEMAVTDPLTGLANHGEFQRRLAFEVGRLQRYASLRAAGHRTSLILVDIDRFKRLNDRFGHPAGDGVLRGVAAALKRSVRSFDIVARYGGEEFAVVLPETGAESAREVADRIRRAVSSYPFALREGSKPVRVTVSVGVATAPESGEGAAQLVEAADAALYRAKESGRNRVFHAADDPEPVAKVLALSSRSRRGRDADRARDASPRARARSSLPKRRTPRA